MRPKYPLIVALWEQNRVRMIVIIVLALLVLALYAGQRWIAEPNLLKLRTEQSQLQKQVRQRQMEFANTGIPVSATEQMEKNLQQFRGMIPAEIDLSRFIGELFQWAQQAGLDIHQISYQPEYDKETKFLRYGLNFSVKGSYPQVKKFIHLLENAKRILVVEKISLVGSESKKKKETVELRIELSTYFQRGAV